MSKKQMAIYLVTERGCLVKETGAFRHIETGVNELGKYADIQLVLGFPESASAEESSTKNWRQNNHSHNGQKDKRKLIGMLRDIKILVSNLSMLPSLYRIIKKARPGFIYERANYLNFNGLLISKFLRINHFYEVNGIQYQRKQKYYASYFNKVVKILEIWSYKKSSFVFFVGSYGEFFQLKTRNWKNIENGIERKFIDELAGIEGKKQTDKLNIVFIANLMSHQRPDLLAAAFNLVPSGKANLHLIGAGLATLTEFLPDDIEIVIHGHLTRSELPDVMRNMHIGIIAGSPEYQSAMKLFDYACFGCVVIAPDIFNFKYWFEDDELVFFKAGDADDLAEKIKSVINQPALYESFGQKLYNKIQTHFTWEAIFYNIFSDINRQLNLNRRNS